MSLTDDHAFRAHTDRNAAELEAEAATEILEMLTSARLDGASRRDLDNRDLLYAFGRI